MIIHKSTITMIASRRITLLTRASEALKPSIIPDFLLPAFVNAPKTRLFSSSSRWGSRIGSAPVSIPAEVHLQLLDPPAKRAMSRLEPPKIAQVEGPLGILH